MLKQFSYRVREYLANNLMAMRNRQILVGRPPLAATLVHRTHPAPSEGGRRFTFPRYTNFEL
jgi:hypothetical protein